MPIRDGTGGTGGGGERQGGDDGQMEQLNWAVEDGLREGGGGGISLWF